MTESVSFWLDNKNSIGTQAALLGDQVLVLYRERYYVVTGGAALTKGGKPLRYSSSLLPAIWKKALKGDAPPPVTPPTATAGELTAQPAKRERQKAEKPVMPEIPQEATPEKRVKPLRLKATASQKVAANPSPPPVAANCPYCDTRHEIPVEKGRGGKPFFMACRKCQREFAVRLVPVTTYQAQVAGFR
jgi:hypothetical protein